MLQYILTESNRYSVAELAQMAIEGGCQWISLSLDGIEEDNLRDTIGPELVDMCKDAGVFLTVEDNPELARQLGLHGVRLSPKFFINHPESSPMALREDLGPEAVIGVEMTDPSAVPSLLPADVDFVSLPDNFTREMRRAFVDSLAKLDVKMPVVAQGISSPEQAVEAIADGCSGVAVGDSITGAPDPVVATSAFLNQLQHSR